MTDSSAIDGTKKAEYEKLSTAQKLMREMGAKFVTFPSSFNNSAFEPFTPEQQFRANDLYDMEDQYWADQWDLLMEKELKYIGPYWGLLNLHRPQGGLCMECSNYGEGDITWPCGSARYGMKWDRDFTLKMNYPKRRLKPQPPGPKTITYNVHTSRNIEFGR
jgi:hypothetical protein